MKKFIWVAGFVLTFAIPTLSQQLPQQQLPDYAFKVTPAEAEIIGKALSKLPYEEVAPLLQKLRTQVLEQQKAPEEKK
jgi:hypothetical protein